jgi:hypothetical protein
VRPQGRHGFHFNLQVEGDGARLRLPRLQGFAPPVLDELLKPFVTLLKSPEKFPDQHLTQRSSLMPGAVH